MNLRTILRRGKIAVVAISIGAAVAIAPQPATAAPVKPDTSTQKRIPVIDVQGVCKLKYGARYCGSEAWNNKVTAAWQWAENHTSKADRRPVPFPGSGSITWVKTEHVIYVVKYQPKDRPTGGYVWKFGQTRQTPWRDRAAVGRRQCENSGKARKGTCYTAGVGATNKSYYNARFLEASMISDYARGHNGKCPPGQRVSCR